MDILCEKKRQDVKEHPDQEWNLPGAKKKSQPETQADSLWTMG